MSTSRIYDLAGLEWESSIGLMYGTRKTDGKMTTVSIPKMTSPWWTVTREAEDPDATFVRIFSRWRDAAVVAAEMLEPQVGTVWIRPNGEVWRLRDYAPDFLSEDRKTKRPSYDVMKPRSADPSTGRRGGFTNGDVLPEDAKQVWAP